jgi:hypothetical protein
MPLAVTAGGESNPSRLSRLQCSDRVVCQPSLSAGVRVHPCRHYCEWPCSRVEPGQNSSTMEQKLLELIEC